MKRKENLCVAKKNMCLKQRQKTTDKPEKNIHRGSYPRASPPNHHRAPTNQSRKDQKHDWKLSKGNERCS